MARTPPPRDPDDDETRVLRPEEETWERAPTRYERVRRYEEPPLPPPRTRRTRVVEEDVPVAAPPPPGPPPADRHLWPWLLLLLVLVLGGLLLLFLLTRDDGGDEGAGGAGGLRPVPSVVRLPLEEARATLERAGFEVQVARRPSDDAARGIVFEQDPEAGSELAAGSQVTVVASSGPATAEVPDVVGLPRAEAVNRLREDGFEVREAQVFSNAEPGSVVGQAPRAGESVDVGSAVRINISRGPGTAEVPDVVGRSAADAAAALEDVGFRSRTVEVPSNEPQGTVVAQSPTAGTRSRLGAAIRLNVSRGRQTAEVPDVVGLQEPEATAILEDAGFTVRRVEEPATDNDGVVIRQVPESGREVTRGARVTIVVTRVG